MWEKKEKNLESYYYEKKYYSDMYEYYKDYFSNNWSDFDTKESEFDRKARIKAEERERKIDIILGE